MIYEGQITLHREMGCGAWPQFHDDRGLHGDKNQYWNWDWTINFIDKSLKIKKAILFDRFGSKLYEGPLNYSRENSIMTTTHIWCPKEVDRTVWLNHVCHYQCKMIIETDEVLKGYDKWVIEQAENILIVGEDNGTA